MFNPSADSLLTIPSRTITLFRFLFFFLLLSSSHFVLSGPVLQSSTWNLLRFDFLPVRDYLRFGPESGGFSEKDSFMSATRQNVRAWNEPSHSSSFSNYPLTSSFNLTLPPSLKPSTLHSSIPQPLYHRTVATSSGGPLLNSYTSPIPLTLHPHPLFNSFTCTPLNYFRRWHKN